MQDSSDPRVARIEWGRLEGTRPRSAGANARLGVHGPTVRPPIARLTMDDGSSGFGVAWLTPEKAQPLMGRRFGELFSLGAGGPTGAAALAAEYPLWDMAGKRAGQPVYALIGGAAPAEPLLRVRCYDTSLYFDDLHLSDEAEAAALIADEARQGCERGHRAFKIKVGRGALHMDVEAGTRRDIAVIRAVRAAVGPEADVLIDANNGYNLNLTKRVLDETADCRLFWIEEAFHEDATLYRNLKSWMETRGLTVRIADGEGEASPSLMAWAKDGLIDVVQYDIFGHGFTRWLETGKQLDAIGAASGPHHYGAHVGNYVSGHLATAIRGMAFIEWDAVDTPGLDAPGYLIEEGRVTIPAAPGFGLMLDETIFQAAVARDGFAL